jgi:DNA-binding transcriptional LysR family regulator
MSPVKFSSNLDYTITPMVKEDLGVSLLPDLMLRTIFPVTPQGIEVRPMDPPAFRYLGIAVRAGEELSPAMDRFIRCAQSVFAEPL